jgi:hypothetical protein
MSRWLPLAVFLASLAVGYTLRPRYAPVPGIEPPLLVQVGGSHLLVGLVPLLGLILALWLLVATRPNKERGM